jgi:hypothetical protein
LSALAPSNFAVGVGQHHGEHHLDLGLDTPRPAIIEVVPCPADFNKSGNVSAQDIFDLLQQLSLMLHVSASSPGGRGRKRPRRLSPGGVSLILGAGHDPGSYGHMGWAARSPTLSHPNRIFPTGKPDRAIFYSAAWNTCADMLISDWLESGEKGS